MRGIKALPANANYREARAKENYFSKTKFFGFVPLLKVAIKAKALIATAALPQAASRRH
jgi:hypothetical protein